MSAWWRAQGRAIENTPVFGSTDRAKDVTSLVGTAMHAAYVVSALAAPLEEEGRDWWMAKARTLSIGLSGNLVQHQIGEQLKAATGRRRPIGGDNAFPSSHATDAAYTSTLVHANLRSTPMPAPLRRSAITALYLLQGAGLWSRVEAGAHRPADVMVGLALGHFLASFVNEAFLHEEARNTERGLQVVAGPGGSLGLGIRYRW